MKDWNDFIKQIKVMEKGDSVTICNKSGVYRLEKIKDALVGVGEQ